MTNKPFRTCYHTLITLRQSWLDPFGELALCRFLASFLVSKVWLARCNVQIQTYWSRCKVTGIQELLWCSSIGGWTEASNFWHLARSWNLARSPTLPPWGSNASTVTGSPRHNLSPSFSEHSCDSSAWFAYSDDMRTSWRYQRRVNHQ